MILGERCNMPVGCGQPNPWPLLQTESVDAACGWLEGRGRRRTDFLGTLNMLVGCGHSNPWPLSPAENVEMLHGWRGEDELFFWERCNMLAGRGQLNPWLEESVETLHWLQ